MKMLCFMVLLIGGNVFAVETSCSKTNIEVGFSPNQSSQDLVLKTINSSKKSICMAAYSFTSKAVSQALISAAKRGVKVKIVVDEKTNRQKYTAATFLANNGINVHFNGKYPIMHNKFIVVDNKTVELGSYNYTNQANKNAENVLVLWNNQDIANKYTTECTRLFMETTS